MLPHNFFMLLTEDLEGFFCTIRKIPFTTMREYLSYYQTALQKNMIIWDMKYRISNKVSHHLVSPMSHDREYMEELFKQSSSTESRYFVIRGRNPNRM